MCDVKLPVPRYYEDLKSAQQEDEMFSYLVLSADHYGVELNFAESYQEMAIDLQHRLDTIALDDSGSVEAVEAHYCMMKMVTLMCQRFPDNYAERMRFLKKQMFKN